MQNKLLLLILALFFTLSTAKAEDRNIDLNKFSGFWLEMLRTPNYSQKTCNYSAINYNVNSSSELEITNLCITFDGLKKKNNLHASLINKNNTNRTFYIEYTAFMGFVKPFSKGNFHIFYVNDDYTIAIVGHPNKSSFWVLSREILDDQKIKETIVLANSLGLNTTKLLFGDYSAETKDDILNLFQ